MLQPPSSTSASLVYQSIQGKSTFIFGLILLLQNAIKNGMGDVRKAHDACNIEDEEYDHSVGQHNHGHENDDISDDDDFVGTFRWLGQAIAL